MIAGAVVLVVAIFGIANYQEEYQRKERLAQAYRDYLYKEKRRQRELRESVWRQIDFVASEDRESGAESYAVYSPTVMVQGGTGGVGYLKVSLAVKWTPALRHEVVVFHFSDEPSTYSAKRDLNYLMERTIDLPMTWIEPDTSYTHTVRLRFFPEEGKPTLGYIVDRKWASTGVIQRFRPPSEMLRLDFSEWYFSRDNIYAEINLAGAEDEINRMREKVKSRYR